MGGLLRAIDSLATAKLSQSLDLPSLRPQPLAGGPAAVNRIEPVGNEAGFPLQTMPGRPQQSASQPALRDPAPQWSAAARMISDVLADLQTEAGPVRGTTPLWPSSQPPGADVLARALAQTVSDSGLFYESHLLEFTQGQRTLAQLRQEPQARLATLPDPAGALAPPPASDAG